MAFLFLQYTPLFVFVPSSFWQLLQLLCACGSWFPVFTFSPLLFKQLYFLLLTTLHDKRVGCSPLFS